jgi:AcrR family transcriptional regulator
MGAPRSTPRIVAELPKLPPSAMRDGTAGRILGAALLLFARNGYHGTSIRQIGDEVGLTPPILYAYFESKEHVLAELVRVGHAVHHAALRRALIDAEGGPIEQIRALVLAHVRMHAEYPMLASVANGEMHALSAELVAPSLALRTESEAMFYDVVQRGAALGVFEPPHPWVTVAAIGGMGMRVANWYRPEVGLSIDQLAEVHAELALRMLGVKGGRR